ncbi:TonB-dependent siderophore receptor [Ectopseudomonas alcaliphila]|uniref:TonB-dependent siderophore receptor n=1 Tax=Ectopseudomonas alcaliphila TaxID=101564 RepID=UPI002780B0EE|nr:MULTISPECIES: TonB-dependent siderophore receptor [Pseudomonas]MDP9941236.1 iron complex outermembrane receptor protein [Pseudomonas sp. 3400]MDR7013455.1 iron complex outermembrane receptor protein [Pseudomonas alcaliphila]
MTDSKNGVLNTRAPWRRVTSVALFCTPLVAAPLYVHAQEASSAKEDEPFRLAPIIVNAKASAGDDASSVVAQELWVGGKVATSILNTPASVSVITQKEIEQRSAGTTEEVLKYTPGVITDYYSTDDRNDYFQIRGFNATTYRDGLTLGSMRGVREDSFAYERVEVLRGANSTLFGPADPGGSVNFVTKKPRFNKFGQVYASYGSFNHKETGIDVGDSLNADQTLAYRFTGKFQDSDREYDHSRDDNQLVMGGLTWAPTAFTEATLVVDHLKRKSTPNSGGYPMDREYDRDEFFGEPGYNFHDVERTNISGSLSHDFDNGFVLRSNLRYSELHDDYGYAYLTGVRTGDMLDRAILGADNEAEQLNGNLMLQYDARFKNIDSSTTVGVEYGDSSTDESAVYQGIDPISVTNPVYTGVASGLSPYLSRKQEYTTKSVFLQQNLSFYERFIVTAGVRNDSMDLSSKGFNTFNAVPAFNDSDSFSETSYRAALTYIATDEISTYISMVESVAVPEVGTTPERGRQYEVGVKYSPMAMNALFSAAIYELTQEDVATAVVQQNGIIDLQSVGEQRVRGLELEAKAELTENLSLVGGYTYMDTEVLRGALQVWNGTGYGAVSIKGNELVTAPKHSASLWTYYSVPGTDVSVGLGARYVGAYYFNDLNDNGESDGTTLFDAAFNYQIVKGTELALNVSNIFDEQHVVGRGTANYYNSGREVTAKLSYNW